jgi:hypothetical protein
MKITPVLILAGILAALALTSCNLDGAGIFKTISQAEPVEDSGYSQDPVRRILGMKGSRIYILHRSSIKYSDTQVASVSWNAVNLPTDLNPSEAVYVEQKDRLVFSALDPDTAPLKSVYVADPASPAVASKVLDSKAVLSIASDADSAYVVTYNSATDDTVIYRLSGLDTSPASAVYHTFSAGLQRPPTAAVFVSETSLTPVSRFYLSYRTDDDEYSVYEATLGSDSLLSLTQLDLEELSPVIGGYGLSGVLYIVTRNGMLLRSTNNGTSFDAVNSDSAMMLSGGSSVAAVPLAEAQLEGGEKRLLIGGDTLYWYDPDSPADIPVRYTQSDTFYANLSASRITDIYAGSTNDFLFYAATADRWLWKITSEGAASSLLL